MVFAELFVFSVSNPFSLSYIPPLIKCSLLSFIAPDRICPSSWRAVISWLSALVMLFSNVIVCPLNVSNFPLTEFISLLKPEEISFITEIADVTAE